MSTRKIIKDINDLFETTGDKVYLCIWNDEQGGNHYKPIVEIHTILTLCHNYADIKDSYVYDKELAYSGKTWRDIFLDLAVGGSHTEDNMYIKRII
tara:strand:- start:42 stop:329 length:288 start_codon:yes stop_codon:yes gene_type:complete